MEAALGHQQALAWLGQVTDHLSCVVIDDGGAHRDGELHVGPAPAGAVGAAAGLAGLGAKLPRVAVVDHGVQVVIGNQEDAAAVAAVAPIGAAEGHGFLTAKAHATLAAGAGLDVDTRFVDEFHK